MLLNSCSSVFAVTRHARKLAVHPEVILECDRRKRDGFARDFNALFCFDRLMQPFVVTPAGHEPAGEFVYDDDFAVFDDVIDVRMHQIARLQRLVDVMQKLHVVQIAQVVYFEEAFGFADALFRQYRRFRFFVQRIIRFIVQTLCESIRHQIHLGAFLALPDMISGVRASSIRIESTSSTMA